jgi:hypothetical protein
MDNNLIAAIEILENLFFKTRVGSNGYYKLLSACDYLLSTMDDKDFESYCDNHLNQELLELFSE